MAEPGQLELLGAQSQEKPSTYRPLSTQKWFTGFVTNRSPFTSGDNRYYTKFLGGRPDQLIGGSNVELTNYGTIIRRPGLSAFPTAGLSGNLLAFYSYFNAPNSLVVIADTTTGVYNISTNPATLLFTKSAGAGQSKFQSVGQFLYFSNGVDAKKWLAVTATWLTNHTYAAGAVVLDSNNNVQQVVSGGTSSGSTPPWAVTAGAFTTDNTISWQNRGPVIANWGIVAPVSAPTWSFQPNSQWTALHAYSVVGFTIIDTNGNIQAVTVTGTSGASAPTWNTVTGGTTTDSGVTWQNGGPIANAPLSGDSYVCTYRNSYTGAESTASPVSLNTGPHHGDVEVLVSCPGSPDPQVDTVRLYRTADGGALYYLDFNSVTGPGPISFADFTLDANLNQQILAPLAHLNDPPPAGAINAVYHLQRIWVVVNNVVYYSGGPDTITGSGVEAFPPANFFAFPSNVNRLVTYPNGLLVFTESDVYVIRGSSTPTFYPQMYFAGMGLRSYNALDSNGSDVYLFTADGQFIDMNSSGVNQMGYPIGDTLQNLNPSLVHVQLHISGQDQAVYLTDGSTGWYRCNPNQPPEGGPAWSPFATLNGGVGAINSVQTSPGVKQLLIGQGPRTSVSYRDPTVFTDLGIPFQANFQMGSVVLAQPGQIAEVESITFETRAVGSIPHLSVLLEEISGVFEQLPNIVPDPPKLALSTTVYSFRAYLAQGAIPILCRHLQIGFSFDADSVKNEILTLSIYGTVHLRDS